MGAYLLYFYKSQNVGCHVFEVVGKGVPENTEFSSNEILVILHIGSISSRKQAMLNKKIMPIIYNRIIH